jgi:hypothetical protein
MRNNHKPKPKYCYVLSCSLEREFKLGKSRKRRQRTGRSYKTTNYTSTQRRIPTSQKIGCPIIASLLCQGKLETKEGIRKGESFIKNVASKLEYEAQTNTSPRTDNTF